MTAEEQFVIVTQEDKKVLLGNISDYVSMSPDCAAFCSCACSCGFCIGSSDIEGLDTD